MAIAGRLEVAGVTSGGTDTLCTGDWGVLTSVAAELAFVDQYVSRVEPTDPGGTDPGGDNGPDEVSGSEPGGGPDSGPAVVEGGCAATPGSASGGLVGLALAMMTIGRRRRRPGSAR